MSASSASFSGASSGRLDFLGGVADYSGSLVLQTPITAKTTVTIRVIDKDELNLDSKQFGQFAIKLSQLVNFMKDAWKNLEEDKKNDTSAAKPANATATATSNGPLSSHPSYAPFLPVLRSASNLAFYASARSFLTSDLSAPLWSRYVIGTLVVFMHAKRWLPPSSDSSSAGLHISVDSEVPAGMGVSSSAALEMATLQAIIALANVFPYPPSSAPPSFLGTETAHLAHAAENLLVGSPCGLMDQLSCSYASPYHLLPIVCRPDLLSAPIPLPKGVRVIGWPSGVRHSVAGGQAPYAVARTAAFIGKKILENSSGRHVEYTAEFEPSFLAQALPAPVNSARHHHGAVLSAGSSANENLFPDYLSLLPVSLRGSDFLRDYGSLDNDSLSSVSADTVYPVRAAVSFPIQENFRCSLVSSLLKSLDSSVNVDEQTKETILRQIGEIMLQSHSGYAAMGLGCEETENMVDKLVREIGWKHGIYGARVSGGGSGGTVVVLLKEEAIRIVQDLCKFFITSKNLQVIL